MDWERADGINRFVARRPLALASACYGVGALGGYYGRVPVMIWAVASVVVGLSVIVRRRVIWSFLFAVFLGAAITSGCAIIPETIPQEGVLIEGRISIEPAFDGFRSVLTIKDVFIDGKEHPHPVRLYVYGDQVSARMGDKVEMNGDTWVPQGSRNPGGFDFAAWLWMRGGLLCATGKTESFSFEHTNGFSRLSFIGIVREGMGAAIDRLFPEQSPLVRALIMGDRNALSGDIQENFRAAGIAHLLAISGLHVSCLAAALEWFLRKFGRSRRQAVLITGVLLIFYAVLIGLPASVVRVVVMFLMMRGSVITGRPPDSLTGLAAAFLFMLIIHPLSIADAGFQLSFSAVAGMLLLSDPAGKLLHIPRGFLWPGIHKGKAVIRWGWAWASGLFATSVAIQMMTLPVIAQTFGTVSPYAPLVNLVAIPLTTMALPLVMAKLVIGSFLEGVGMWFSLPDMMLRVLIQIADCAAEIPYGMVNVPHWPFWLVIVYLAVCVCASPYVKFGQGIKKSFVCVLFALAMISVVCARLSLPGGLNIAFLDAGQADAMVIRAEGKTYVMDVGKENGPTDEYLAYTGQGLDAVFLSHPHADHVGGLKELARRMRIPRVYVPECWSRAEAEGDIVEVLEKMQRAGTEIIELAAGDEVQLSEKIIMTVLQPERGYTPGDGNDGSMVVKVAYGEGAALLTGDLRSADELKTYPDVDVLKAAHHGAKSSNSDLMLHLTRPSVMVISVGRNTYGHPAERVINSAQAQGAMVYRTDECGAIFAQIEQDGPVRMETFLSAEGERQ